MKITLLVLGLLALTFSGLCHAAVYTNEALFQAQLTGEVDWSPNFSNAPSIMRTVPTPNNAYLDENTYIPFWIPANDIPMGVYFEAFDTRPLQPFSSNEIHLVRNFPTSAASAVRSQAANSVLADSNHYYNDDDRDGLHVHFDVPVNAVGFQLEKAPGCDWSNFGGPSNIPETTCYFAVEALQGIYPYFNEYLTVLAQTNKGNYYVTVRDPTYNSAFDFNYFLGLLFDEDVRIYDIYMWEPYIFSGRVPTNIYNPAFYNYGRTEVNPRLVGFNWMEFNSIRSYCKNFPPPNGIAFGPIDGQNLALGTADFDETDFGFVGIYIIDVQVHYSFQRISPGQTCTSAPRTPVSPNQVSFTVSSSTDGGAPVVYGENSILLMPNGTYPAAGYADAGNICVTFTDSAAGIIPQDVAPVSGIFQPVEPFSDHMVGECADELSITLEIQDNIVDQEQTCIYTAWACVTGQTPPPDPSSGTCVGLDGYLDQNGDFEIIDPELIAPNSVGCFNSETLSQTSFDCTDVGANTVIWTGIDTQGLTATCTVNTVNIFDTIPPEANCINTLTLNLDASGSATINDLSVFDNPSLPSSDNCPFTASPFTTTDTVTFTCADIMQYPAVNIRVTDDSANFDTCTSIVDVRDVTAPAITCLAAGTTVNVGDNVNIITSATDACSTPFLTNNLFIPQCSQIGTNVNFGPATATDSSGNSASCSTTLTVVDNVPPTALCRASPVTIAITSGSSYTVQPSDIDAGSFDNCGFTLSVNTVTLNCNSSPQTVTLTVTGGGGAQSTCSTTVQVSNNGPVASCAVGTIARSLTASGTYQVLPSDIDNGSGLGCGSPSGLCSSGSCLTVSPSVLDCENIFFGTSNGNSVTLTIEDPTTGLQDTCVGSISVTDSIVPVADCKPSITLDYNDACIASTTASFVDDGSSDNCGRDNLSLSITPASWSFSTVPQSTQLVATDRSGNASPACITSVILRDVTAPVARCQDHEVSLNNAVETLSTNQINSGSSDNCGVNGLSLSRSTVSCEDAGKAIDVVLTVLDTTGNSDTCVGTVSVTDDIAPTALCATTRVSIGADGAPGQLSVDEIDANSNDACGISNMFVSGTTTYSCADVGNTIGPVLNVIDNSGNSATCTASVLVQDLIPPDANCVAEKTLFAGASGTVTVTTADLNDPSNPSTDNCPGFALSIVGNSLLNCGFRGYITLRNTDVYGNTGDCTTYVTVLDQIDPSIACRSTTVDIGSDGRASIVTSDIVVSATDNCGTPAVRLSKTGFTCFDIGFVQVTATATDTFGNVDSCVSTVVVQDLIDPVAQCKAEIVVDLDANGEVTANGLEANAGSFDNCIDLTYVVTPSKFTCEDVGTITGNLTVIDGAGNVDSCQLSIVIADDISPEALCADYTVTVPSEFNGIDISADNIDFGSFDNCGIQDLSVSPNNVGLGETRVTLTVTDSSGNVDSCTATVTVVRVEDNPSSANILSSNPVLFFLFAFTMLLFV